MTLLFQLLTKNIIDNKSSKYNLNMINQSPLMDEL